MMASSGPPSVRGGGNAAAVSFPNEPVLSADSAYTPGPPPTHHPSHLRHHHHSGTEREEEEVPEWVHRCPECGNPCEGCTRIHDSKRIHPDGDATEVDGYDAYGLMYATPKAVPVSPKEGGVPRRSNSSVHARRERRASIVTVVVGGEEEEKMRNGSGHQKVDAGEEEPAATTVAEFEVEEEEESESDSDDGQCCKTGFTVYNGIEIRCFGMDFVFDVVLYLLGILFIGIAWLGLWTALPDHLTEPAGAILGPMSTIIVCTFVGQYIVGRSFGLPPIVGIFFTSILWNHIYEQGFLSQGTFKVLRFVISRVGLSTILVRAGMALSWKSIKPTVFYTSALATVPLALETVLSAGMSYALFDEFESSWKWSFLYGIMASVIAAGIVAPELLSLVAQGYVTGPVPLALSAVGFDTALGVWGIGIINQLLFSDLEVGLLSALAPLQLLGGVLLGILVAFLFCVLMRLLRRNMWRNQVAMRRFTLAYFLSIALSGVFFGEQFDLSGGGTVFALTFATAVGHMLDYETRVDENNLVEKMKKMDSRRRSTIGSASLATMDGFKSTLRPGGNGSPVVLPSVNSSSSLPNFEDEESQKRQTSLLAAIERGRHCAAVQRADLVLDLRDFWDLIVAGPLFSMSGTLVDIVQLFSVDFFPKGILIFVVGSVVRLLASALTVSFGSIGFGWREIVFLALSWFGKGAVQAATGGVALDTALSRQEALGVNATAFEVERAAKDVAASRVILNSAILYIMFTAPLCAAFITKLGPVLLTKPADGSTAQPINADEKEEDGAESVTAANSLPTSTTTTVDDVNVAAPVVSDETDMQ